MIRSALEADGQRCIVVTLNGGHLLVGRSLKRADSLTIKFITAMALAEYVGYWNGTADGKAIRAAIAELDPEAREMLAEMAGESIKRQRYILSHIKALGQSRGAEPAA